MYSKDRLTFESLPDAISYLIKEVEYIKHHLLNDSTSEAKIIDRHYTEKEILSVADVCKILGLKMGSIYNLNNKRKIPHYKQGGRVYYKRSEINEWLQSDKRKTLQELKSEASQALEH